MGRRRQRSRDRKSERKSERNVHPQNWPLLAVLAAGVVALAAGGYFLVRWWGSTAAPPEARVLGAAPAGASLPGTPSGGAPTLTVTPRIYDLGQVSQAAGTVTVRMTVTNTGSADLIITEMETSCGCTRARLVVDGRAGPWFGMRGHAPWPTGWSAHLRPGQRGTLIVQYDPGAHGVYRGPIDRVVVIHSNDPRQPRASVRLIGLQVP